MKLSCYKPIDSDRCMYSIGNSQPLAEPAFITLREVEELFVIEINRKGGFGRRMLWMTFTRKPTALETYLEILSLPYISYEQLVNVKNVKAKFCYL